MTALKGRAIDAFFSDKGKGANGVLIYGPDEGLARERSDALAKAVAGDLKDAFTFIDLTDGDLSSDPAKLSDELTSLSLMGGDRAVRVRVAGEAAPAAVKDAVEAIEAGTLKPAAFLIVDGRDLSKRSSLRKLFEGAKTFAAAPCYVEGSRGARDLAQRLLKEAGVAIDAAALDLLSDALGDDRRLTRNEIEKLILYASDGGEGDKTVALDDVRAVVSGAGEMALDALIDAACEGRPDILERELAKSNAGGSPLGLLRMTIRRFDRLHAVGAAVRSGANLSEAMSRLRPPVFFAQKDAFARQARLWPEPAARAALDMLLQAEIAAKRTGAPQRLLTERALMSLCRKQSARS